MSSELIRRCDSGLPSTTVRCGTMTRGESRCSHFIAIILRLLFDPTNQAANSIESCVSVLIGVALRDAGHLPAPCQTQLGEARAPGQPHQTLPLQLRCCQRVQAPATKTRSHDRPDGTALPVAVWCRDNPSCSSDQTRGLTDSMLQRHAGYYWP